MPIPVLIDTDMGADDAVAILLATASAVLDVRAIVGVGGCVSLDHVMQNVGRVLHALDPPSVPFIGRGLDQTAPGLRDRGDVFGEDGLGGFDEPLLETMTPVDFRDAYCQAIEAADGELNVLAIGPMTNLAAVLAADGDVKRSIKHLYVAGGAVWSKGNVNEATEFNFYRDPSAARRVLDSGLPITVVPLDVTGLVCLDQSHVAHLAASDGKIAQIAARVLEHGLAFGGEPAAGKVFVHAAVAAGAMIWPELFMRTKMRLDVTTAGKQGGRSQPALGGDKSKRVDLLTAVNAVDFLENLLECLCRETFIV